MILQNYFNLKTIIPFNLAANYARYLFLALPCYWIFWKTPQFTKFKIQKKPAQIQKHRAEFKTSILATSFFTLVAIFMYFGQKLGLAHLYFNIHDQAGGWGYWFFSLIFCIFFHDTYFYWIHRLMHTKVIYRQVHSVHHRWTDPTPLASNAFHFLEVVLEAGVVPVVALLLPLHVSVIVIWAFLQFFFNLLAHLGFDPSPDYWLKHPLLKYVNMPLNHNLHHSEFNYNYGFYFNFWDRAMGTLDPDYEKKFDLMVKSRDLI